MRRVILAAILVAAGSLPLWAGGQRAVEGPDVEAVTEVESVAVVRTVAVVAGSLQDPVYLDARAAAEAAARELDTTLVWLAPVQLDAAEQVRIIEGAIRRGAGAILVSPLDAAALRGVIDQAVAAGIVVGTFGRDAAQSRRRFYVGTEDYTLGARAAERLLRLVEGMRSPVDVAVLTGPEDDSVFQERLMGMRDTLNGSNVRIVDVLSAGGDVDRSVAAVSSYTEGYPGLDAWLFSGGWPLLAGPQQNSALMRFRDRGGLVVSLDSHYPLLDAVRLNMVDYLVGVDMAAVADAAVRTAVRVMRGEAGVQPLITIEPEIVDRDNVADISSSKTPW